MSAYIAARYRGIEKVNLPFLESSRKGLGFKRRDRTVVDHDQAGFARLDDAVGAEEDRFDIRRVCYIDKENLTDRRDMGWGRPHRCAEFCQRITFVQRTIMDKKRVPSLE